MKILNLRVVQGLCVVLGASIAMHAGTSIAGNSLKDTRLREPQGVDVFVQLQTPSVGEVNAQALQSKGSVLDAASQREHAARISQEQAEFDARLRGMGLNPRYPQRVGANGIRVRATAAQIAQLRSMPEVRSVAKVERHVPDNIDSVPWIGTQQAWARGLTGKGITIGIIDTGIDYTHANFGGAGDPADYEANDPNLVEKSTFPTAKVAGGHDFAGAEYNADDPATAPVEDDDPLDVVGHGSHVAGTAAGIGVPDSIGPGVAKDATLYSLKVFGDVEGSTELTSLAIEWAMDPNGDGDMSDHLDVINMSLGGPLGSPDDPSSISSNTAVANGIVVVASAGNENDVPYVTGAPAVAQNAISVAASIPGGRNWARFQVTAPADVAGTYPSEEGAGLVRFEDVGTVTGELVSAAPADGCETLTNPAAISGKIALIIRGTCDFLVKYTNAQNAGARAIIVYNDGTAPDRIDPIVMGGLDDTITIPGLMISYTIGNTLVSASGVQVTVDTQPDPTRDDRIGEFSSRGPGHGGSIFKPDLAAPGVGIVSTGVGTGTGSSNLDGTSMAAPHVAGAAAILLQKWPHAAPKAIKALLQNSSVSANDSGNTVVARQGVGLIRINRAIELTSYASPGGVSFGRINRVFPTLRTRFVTLHNLDTTRRAFNVKQVNGQIYPGVHVQCPSHVVVGPEGAARFEITMSFDPTRAAKNGVFDNASISQSEVDGWCVLSNGDDSLRVAYLGVVDAASRTIARLRSGGNELGVGNLGPAPALAEGFTWAADNGEVPEAEGTTAGLFRVGYRTADPALYIDEPVIEFGIATDAPWEHLSDLRFDFFLDVDDDGTDDVHLAAADLSTFADVDPGLFVTAQFEVGGEGGLDWPVLTWDFNDRVAILPFTKVGGTLGQVPPAFNYRLEVTGPDGSVDVQHGSIDTAKEIGLDLNSFGLDPFDTATIHVTKGTGDLLFLYPNDTVPNQTQKVGPVSPQ
ncbi:MAG: S8 family serine peptidase [Steroidobacteraceae bacterium]